MSADGQSFVVRGVNYMLTSISPKLGEKGQERALDRWTYNVLGYYVYNGCVYTQAILGIAIPIINALSFTFRFSTGFWFLFTAQLIKWSIFHILIRHEIGDRVPEEVQVKQEVDHKQENPASREVDAAPAAGKRNVRLASHHQQVIDFYFNKYFKPLYLLGRIVGVIYPDRDNDACVLKKHGINPAQHERWRCQKPLLWGLASGFNLLPDA